jgi:hypothetical protein
MKRSEVAEEASQLFDRMFGVKEMLREKGNCCGPFDCDQMAGLSELFFPR